MLVLHVKMCDLYIKVIAWVVFLREMSKGDELADTRGGGDPRFKAPKLSIFGHSFL